MRRLDLTSSQVTAFGSKGVAASPHARVAKVEGAGVDVLRFGADSLLGRHPTGLWQLFSVLDGQGWASGASGERATLVAGNCVLWEPGEEHESGSDDGMLVLVVRTPIPPLPDLP